MAREARVKVLLSLSPHLGWCQFQPRWGRSRKQAENNTSVGCARLAEEGDNARDPLRALVLCEDIV